MNFMEAVEEMKKGNKVRHKNSEKISDNFYYYYDKESNRVLNGFEQDIYMDLIMIGATDWEVFEEDKDWNLAKYVRARTKYDFERHYTTEDVKKCRDLIIKKNFEKAAGSLFIPLIDVKKIINETFGDL